THTPACRVRWQSAVPAGATVGIARVTAGHAGAGSQASASRRPPILPGSRKRLYSRRTPGRDLRATCNAAFEWDLPGWQAARQDGAIECHRHCLTNVVMTCRYVFTCGHLLTPGTA